MPVARLPEIKLRKVGKDRERKKKLKGGIAWLYSGGRAGVIAGAGDGGSGLFSQLERVFGERIVMAVPKVLIVGLLSSMGIGAYGIGHLLQTEHDRIAAAPAMPKALSAMKKGAADAADALRAAANGDSVDLIVQEARDGKTDAQRAAEAAEAKAAADAKAQADAKAHADAAGPAPAAPQADPAGASAAAGEAPRLGQVKSPFGAFKTSFDGNSAGTGKSLEGWGFGQKMSIGGRLAAAQPMPAGPTPAMVAAPHAAKGSSTPLAKVRGGGRGLGFNQLNRASQLSGAATQSNVSETASQNAQNAFQPDAGGDSSIAGPSGAPDAAHGAGGSSGGFSGGGSEQSGNNAAINAENNGLSMCDTMFPSGGFVMSASGACVCPPGQDSNGQSCQGVHHVNATPWQKLVDTGKALTLTAAALLAAATLLGLLANHMDLAYGTGEIVRQVAIWLCGIATLLSAVVLMIGFSISGYGGEAQRQGFMFQLMGGLMTAVSAVAWHHYQSTNVSDWVNNVSYTVEQGFTNVASTPIAAGGLGAIGGAGGSSAAGGPAAAH